MVGAAPAPLDQEEGRVVGGDPAPFLHQGTGQTPRHLLHVSTQGALNKIDHAFLAELLPAGCMLLDETVGEEQHPVTAPERLLADLRDVTTEADGQGSRALQRLDDPVVTDQ